MEKKLEEILFRENENSLSIEKYELGLKLHIIKKNFPKFSEALNIDIKETSIEILYSIYDNIINQIKIEQLEEHRKKNILFLLVFCEYIIKKYSTLENNLDKRIYSQFHFNEVDNLLNIINTPNLQIADYVLKFNFSSIQMSIIYDICKYELLELISKEEKELLDLLENLSDLERLENNTKLYELFRFIGIEQPNL